MNGDRCSSSQLLLDYVEVGTTTSVTVFRNKTGSIISLGRELHCIGQGSFENLNMPRSNNVQN